ncbi:hypothetical protein EJB05_30138, partial [Eragrostis curvula]
RTNELQLKEKKRTKLCSPPLPAPQSVPCHRPTSPKAAAPLCRSCRRPFFTQRPPPCFLKQPPPLPEAAAAAAQREERTAQLQLVDHAAGCLDSGGPDALQLKSMENPSQIPDGCCCTTSFKIKENLKTLFMYSTGQPKANNEKHDSFSFYSN